MWQKSVTKIELFPLARSGIRAEMREEQQTVMYKAAPHALYANDNPGSAFNVASPNCCCWYDT